MDDTSLYKTSGQLLSESSESVASNADPDVRVEMCLRCWSITGLEEVKVRVYSGTVVLRGEVMTSTAKYQVAECCRHIPRVRNVVDALSVVRSR